MKLYNSYSKKIEDFTTFKPKKVLMYVCGITPYDTTHLGHAFLYVFFDALSRYLKFLGYEINYTQNVTDIDDDILKKAKQESKDWQKLGKFWTNKFLRDLNSLNVELPNHFVKATDSIPKIIEMVNTLLSKGFAYQKNGNIYFEIAKFPKYGKLSGFNYQQMLHISSERGGDIKDKNKKDPLDFILWQKSKTNEPFWKSPWGNGRPGWHIECSAMAHQYLGEQIDIHGGGKDLIFPHHESEIAQSESYTGKSFFSKYWLHASMLMYQGEKMSKSLGNLIMVSDLLKKYSANAIRLCLLSHHYQTPWEFRYDDLKKAEKKVLLIEETIRNTKLKKNIQNSFVEKFKLVVENDANFPSAIAILIHLVNDSNQEAKDSLAYLYNLLGFKTVS